MKTKRIVIAGLAALAFLAGVAAAPAEAQYRRPARGYAGAVDLTEEQMDRIQEIRMAFQNEILPIETKLRKVELELDALSWKGQSLDAKLAELDTLELELDKMWEEHQARIRSVLTDGQRRVFDRQGGLGLGLGWGPDDGMGLNPRMGARAGVGRGLGYGYGPGVGRGYGRYSRYGRGYGRGLGRGYTCPWRRW